MSSSCHHLFETIICWRHNSASTVFPNFATFGEFPSLKRIESRLMVIIKKGIYRPCTFTLITLGLSIHLLLSLLLFTYADLSLSLEFRALYDIYKMSFRYLKELSYNSRLMVIIKRDIYRPCCFHVNHYRFINSFTFKFVIIYIRRLVT